MRVRVTMLGSGGSQGVPDATGDWGAANPAEPRNRRLRPSVLIEAPDHAGTMKALLVDTGPDLREQMLRSGTRRLDGVLFTHSHADHTHGIDELRSFNRHQSEPMPIWGSALTIEQLRERFAYALVPDEPGKGAPFYKPSVVPHAIEGAFNAAGVPVVAFPQDHGFMPSLGFRVGDFAYSTDFVRIGAEALEALEGVKVWIVDCVRVAPAHPTHCHLAQALHWISLVKPERAILTHMDPTIDYATISRLLPPGVEPGWDGLVIEI